MSLAAADHVIGRIDNRRSILKPHPHSLHFINISKIKYNEMNVSFFNVKFTKVPFRVGISFGCITLASKNSLWERNYMLGT